MQATGANQTKVASKVTLSPRSRWESVLASHRANPSEANPESKQLVPLCIATKASHNSSTSRKSDRTGRQNHPLTSFSLGVGPSKPQSQSQPSNPESKQLVPLCIATKSSRKSGKRRKSDRTAGRIVRLPRSSWESIPTSNRAS